MKAHCQWAVKPLVPEDVYTDRQEFLKVLHHVALEAIPRRSMSTVLLGQRRMGKTEIFKRVVNRLFFEQDHTDPQAVVPVYFSFPDEVVSRLDFAIKYVENFIRWYTAFRLRQPEIISGWTVKREELVPFIKRHLKVTEGFTRALNIFEWLQDNDVTIPAQAAVMTPREVSDWDDSTIVMFLDEFQNTSLPEYQFRVVGFMQEAVQRKFSDYKGYVAEVFLIQILWNSQRKTLPGRYFHSPEEIEMPDRFSYIDQRHRLRAGEGLEVDVYAAAGLDIWLAESKWWVGRSVGTKEVEHLIQQGELVREREGEAVRVWLWLFAHDGVTPEAEELLRNNNVFWSTRADVDALLEEVHLRRLPEL